VGQAGPHCPKAFLLPNLTANEKRETQKRVAVGLCTAKRLFVLQVGADYVKELWFIGITSRSSPRTY
jgi:hypothetical protein